VVFIGPVGEEGLYKIGFRISNSSVTDLTQGHDRALMTKPMKQILLCRFGVLESFIERLAAMRGGASPYYAPTIVIPAKAGS